MATIAQRDCARYPDVTIERRDFEHWQPPPAEFELLDSA